MEYLTKEEYIAMGGTTEVSPDVFISAKEKIDSMTFHRIVFKEMTDFQKEKIRRAMFLLINFYIENPEYMDSTEIVTNYSVGDIHVTIDKNSLNNSRIIQYGVPNSVYEKLKATGLTYRGFSL